MEEILKEFPFELRQKSLEEFVPESLKVIIIMQEYTNKSLENSEGNIEEIFEGFFF